jgi:hypothetical protein
MSVDAASAQGGPGGCTPPVRTLTLGLADAHPLGDGTLERAAEVLGTARDVFVTRGYEVQTVRLSARPLLGDMGAAGEVEVEGYLSWLHDRLGALGVSFLALGPLWPLARQLGRAEHLAATLAPLRSLSWSVMVAAPGEGVDVPAAEAAGRVMAQLASADAEGLGNFNFAAVARVRPGTPFFPAAYHDGPGTLGLGLQAAGVVRAALEGGAPLGEVQRRVASAVGAAGRPPVELCMRVCEEAGVRFGGIDLSPAPAGPDSIVAAMEGAGHGSFGGPGTLALCAAVTAGLRSTGLPTCGYCGLMLPVMEDSVLARRWEQGLVGIDQLLAFSAVCGTGLDTVPLPGATPAAQLARVATDMASLAVRYDKPLSARLMPFPGARAGERTRFASPYLVDAVTKALPAP